MVWMEDIGSLLMIKWKPNRGGVSRSIGKELGETLGFPSSFDIGKRSK